jgi:hypothetical protein
VLSLLAAASVASNWLDVNVSALVGLVHIVGVV